ncbi:hypothetical protein KSS87_015963 [Heliosperma pusillum]|nr:hypothetical protein KSS87_015963 [Heliosperma pusillum]
MAVVFGAVAEFFYPNREAAERATPTDEQNRNNNEIARRRPPFEINPYEDIIACGVINPNDIDVDFNSIGGLEKIKQTIAELVILPLTRPDLFAHGRLLGPQKGVLLYGPPGTGKTMIAKAIAKQAGAPAIIFIDEVDSFLGQRRDSEHEVMTSMKTEFMSMWDGFTTDQNGTVMVLAATNRPWVLDEAILRRFSKCFEIGLPDHKERASILKVILKDENVEENIDYDYLAGLCENCTGSDLSKLCKDTALLPFREYLEAETRGIFSSGPRPMTQSDFEYAFRSSKNTKTAAEEYSNRASTSSQRI